MSTARFTSLPVIAIATSAVMTFSSHGMLPRDASSRWCTLVPGRTVALVRVERDTTLPITFTDINPMSASSVLASPRDSLLVSSGTLMPAGRVRLLHLDSATRAILADAGVRDSQPVAFIRAAPYRADCLVVRWTDTIPFVVRGEVGYVRGTLAPREQWVGAVPVFIIPEVWYYPYPRRRAVAFNVAPTAPIASAEAMYSLNALIGVARFDGAPTEDAGRRRVVDWARANTADAELEPARTIVRRAVLDPDWAIAERAPSRLRGSYRVDMDVNGERSTWFFRTVDRPAYPWRGPDSLQTTAQLLGSPHVLGYRLVGYAGSASDSLVRVSPRGSVHPPLVWLCVTDRPTAPDNERRNVLPSMLELTLASAPERAWNDLEAFVPPMSAMDSAALRRMHYEFQRSRKQAQLPLTIRLDDRGGVNADTTFTLRDGRTMRVILSRIDTSSLKRSF